MGDVTELSLRAEGVTFDRFGGRVQPFGPSGRLDLRDALRAEVARRADQMLPRVALGGEPTIAREPAPPRSGRCCLCAEQLHGPQSGGHCAICTLALHLALVRAGRLTT